MSETHDGGCLCGFVRYRVSGRPVRALVCHCRFCQKMTGSSFYAQAMFEHAAVAFSGGEMRCYDHLSRGSGKRVHLHFCPQCGTAVTLTLERFPLLRTVARGTFDDPDWFRADAHIFTESAQHGVVLPASTDCYAQMRVTLDGEVQVPVRFTVPQEVGAVNPVLAAATKR